MFGEWTMKLSCLPLMIDRVIFTALIQGNN